MQIYWIIYYFFIEWILNIDKLSIRYCIYYSTLFVLTNNLYTYSLDAKISVNLLLYFNFKKSFAKYGFYKFKLF